MHLEYVYSIASLTEDSFKELCNNTVNSEYNERYWDAILRSDFSMVCFDKDTNTPVGVAACITDSYHVFVTFLVVRSEYAETDVLEGLLWEIEGHYKSHEITIVANNIGFFQKFGYRNLGAKACMLYTGNKN